MSEQQFTPEGVAASLQAKGQNGEARLIRAIAEELATVRAERDSLATFARSIAHLSGRSLSRNASLSVRATEALDTLRVTERCPSRENGKHRWMRSFPGIGSRCFSCHARRPGT